MAKTRAVTRYRRSPPAKRSSTLARSSNFTTLLVIGAIILIAYLLLQSRQAGAGQYNNIETWDIKWDEKTMLPTSVSVHREATRR